MIRLTAYGDVRSFGVGTVLGRDILVELLFDLCFLQVHIPNMLGYRRNALRTFCVADSLLMAIFKSRSARRPS